MVQIPNPLLLEDWDRFHQCIVKERLPLHFGHEDPSQRVTLLLRFEARLLVPYAPESQPL